MPYSNASDANLPAAVQKLPKALRELWVRVFNENYKAEDEAWGFKMAWGAVRKVQSAKKARLLRDLDLNAWLAARAAERAIQPVFAQLEIKQQRDGRIRWKAISTGAFRDRDQEIVSKDYLQSALDFAARYNQRGRANIWHVRNSDVATCDLQELVGEPPVLLESGLFDDTPAGRRAAAYYAAHAPETGMSIEFAKSQQTPDGVYLPPGVITRRSFLPRHKAAFEWSALAVKESEMPNARPDQIAHIAEVFDVPLDEATAMVEYLEAGTKRLAELGVDWKELNATANAVAAEPEPEANADTPVAAEAAPADAPVVETSAAEPAPAEPVVAEPQVTEVILGHEVIEQMAARVLEAVNATLTEVRTAITALTGNQTSLSSALSAQAQGLKELDAVVKSLQAADDAKIAAAVQDLPRATVKSLQAGERPSQRQPDAQLPQESQLARMKQVIHG